MSVIDSVPPDDDDFPLGDGAVDTGATVRCPCCGEVVEIELDPGGGAAQDYVEDCPVCCRPWRVRVYYGAHGIARVAVTALDQ